jgi:GNAT superfamily N-acetyltransferase
MGILLDKKTNVKLAALTDDHDICLGFSVYSTWSRRVLEYVHVHKDYRRQGIARALVPEDIKCVSHLTRTGRVIWQKHMSNIIFNPFYFETT